MADIFEATRPDDYLMRLAASDLGRGYKSMVTAELALADGHTAVDVGCGPGADLLAFSAAVGADGLVVGIDHDIDAVEAARELVAEAGNVTVRTGDAHQLDLDTGSVDRAHTDRVLQHVADPGRAVDEVARVLRPGGRAVLAEPDWGTLAVDGPDRATTHAYQAYVVEEVVRNAWMGRRLPALVERSGLSVGRVVPVTAVFQDAREADAVLGLGRVARRARDAGHLDPDAYERWVAHLTAAPFFASVTLFIVVADR